MSHSGSTCALPLPSTSVKQKKSPIWPVDDATVETPLVVDCDRSVREDGTCCKEFIEDKRTLINPDIVRDVVIGLSDGLTVPFALAAGLSSLGESKLVVLGGIAELIAGAISMGIGGFFASQAERDHYRYLRHYTAQRVTKTCVGEMEREVSEVLAPVGVDEKTCRAVARCLRDAEAESKGNGTGDGIVPEHASLKWDQDIGLTAFLLKFGQGLEEIPNRRMYVSAFTIGMGYLIGGFIPLVPYFFIPLARVALIYSCIVTGIVLLVFGAVKARVTGASQSPAGYVWGALSTFMVGGLAAAAAFGIVRILEGGAQ